MEDGFKRSDTVGTFIIHVSTDDMVLNTTLDILSATNRGGWNIRDKNRISLYLDVFKIFCIQEEHYR